MSEQKVHAEAEMKGWLFKWTNYLKGYQRRWFVLSNGILSYYRNQAEMAHTCRGTISLHGALIHTEDSCTFVISNGGTQTFHIKAASEVERQRWVTALELAKAKAIQAIESEEEEGSCYESGNQGEIVNMIKALNSRLENLQTCNELITKHGSALQRTLSELETLDNFQDVSAKVKAINERATLFRITSKTMINTCSEYLELAKIQGRKWQRVLQHEREQRQRLQEMVEQLARQHSMLEQAAKEHHIPRPGEMPRPMSSPTTDEEDESVEFYDAQSDDNIPSCARQCNDDHFILKIPKTKRCQSRRQPGVNLLKHVSEELMDLRDEASGSSSDVDELVEPQQEVLVIPGTSSHAVGEEGTNKEEESASYSSSVLSSVPSTLQQKDGTVRQRRTRVPEKPNCPLSLWSIMKNCIGKELSKIPMPVNFSEPLSMLQRLTEDYEYAEVLDRAACCADSCEQLAYVAAFTVSSYSTTANRTGKPFNPLLGETYECDRREDLGWRAISEQVSHHPPMVAQHCEGRDWTCWQEFTMTSKFRGKYLQVTPLGTAHLIFNKSGNHYTWRKVTTTVHNIIVGKLWVDQHGDMDIINHADGSKCHLSYIPYSYFNRDTQRKVKGCVMDKDGKVRWIINGTWDNQIEIAPVISTEGTPDNPVYKTGEYTLAWRIRKPPEDCEKYYNFTILACQLNEMEDGIAPTDSRFRPDQRLMEEGRWEEANVVKVSLEEKQRAARKAREKAAEIAAGDGLQTPANAGTNKSVNNNEEEFSNEDLCSDSSLSKFLPPYEPIWFKKEVEPITGSIAHLYKGGYWEAKDKQDWNMCPNIF
ncbi:oxysterol binding protein isoform X2 [Lycorma delicatula]|uniref:oxysterol binding protein isoform X2 n=1 Tax=Lycorma delicatula TaxID=130591 RepID=UPI003F514F6C